MNAAGVNHGREKALQSIIESANKASSLESWGMPVEATAEYSRGSVKIYILSERFKCYRQVTLATTTRKESFTDSEKEFLLRVARVMEMRANALQDSTGGDEATSSDCVNVTEICQALQEMIQGEMTPLGYGVFNKLPAASVESRSGQKARSLFLSDDDYALAIKAMGKGGTLVKRKQMLPGRTYVTITIDKIGMKDPQNYIDPQISVTTRTKQAVLVEEQQDTPVSTKQREVAYVPFEVDVELSTPLEDIPHDTRNQPTTPEKNSL